MSPSRRLGDIVTLSRVLLAGLVVLVFIPFTCTSRDRSDKTYITIWTTTGNTPAYAILDRQIAEFEQLNPDIEVKREEVASDRRTQKYLAAMQAGSAADVLYMHWRQVPVFAAKDMLVPMDRWIREEDYDLDDFFKSSLIAYQYDGQQVALPEKGSTQLLFYNKDLFDAAGVGYPTDDWTVDDFLDAATKLTKIDDNGRIYQVGGLPYDAASWVWTMGGRFATDDLDHIYFTDPGTINAAQLLWNMRNDWQITTRNMNARGRDPASVDVFEKGNIAMAVGGPWNFPVYEEISDFNWDIALFPKGPGGRATRYAAMGYAIWSGSKHPEAAWKLVKHLLSQESMSEIRGEGYTDMPARKSVAYGEFAQQDAPFDMDVLLKSMDPEYADVKVLPKNEQWPLLERIFFEELDLALMEYVTPAEAMKNAQARAERILAVDHYQVTAKDYIIIAALPVLVLGIGVWRHKHKQHS